jgi:hypothetical protein
MSGCNLQGEKIFSDFVQTATENSDPIIDILVDMKEIGLNWD